MEEAIYITNLKFLGHISDKYTRVYFGNEFCERLCPSLEDLREISIFCKKKGLNLTFVTPFLTNEGIKKWGIIVDAVLKESPNTEIVVNDIGFFRLLKEKYGIIRFVWGRLLVKQKRGPRILNVWKRLPHSAQDHFMRASSDSGQVRSFLADNCIQRVELDNLVQGIIRDRSTVKGSLYYPFGYLTTTRFCLLASGETVCRNSYLKNLRSIKVCNLECQKYEFKLTTKDMPQEIYLKGNTQFFKNEKFPNLKENNIDRLVYQPSLPV